MPLSAPLPFTITSQKRLFPCIHAGVGTEHELCDNDRGGVAGGLGVDRSRGGEGDLARSVDRGGGLFHRSPRGCVRTLVYLESKPSRQAWRSTSVPRFTCRLGFRGVLLVALGASLPLGFALVWVKRPFWAAGHFTYLRDGPRRSPTSASRRLVDHS